MSKRLISKRPVSSEKTRTQSLLALTKKPEDRGQDCRTHLKEVLPKVLPLVPPHEHFQVITKKLPYLCREASGFQL